MIEIKGYEQYLYDKWLRIFSKQIAVKYPGIEEQTRKKLALENARYFNPVDDPTTIMNPPKTREADLLIPPIIDDTLLAYEYMDDMWAIKESNPLGLYL